MHALQTPAGETLEDDDRIQHEVQRFCLGDLYSVDIDRVRTGV